MKYLLLLTLVSNAICAASSSSTGSPARKNIHSKSTGEIPSLAAVSLASQAINIPPTKGHERKRSKSELEIQSENPWASPPSNATSPTSWTSSHALRPELQKQTSLGLVSTHRPRRLTQEEIATLKEKKWRQLRKNQFGPSHKRTNSLPSSEKMIDQYHLMELSEQYSNMKQMQHKTAYVQLEAIRTQKEFKDEAGKAGALLSLMETTNFEEFVKRIAQGSLELQANAAKYAAAAQAEAARYEELRKVMLSMHLEHLSEVNQLVGHVNKLTAKLDHIMNILANSNALPCAR